MEPSGRGYVWYAAFGSNLLRERFVTYLTGGPVPRNPTNRVHDGARDRSPPRADRAVELPHRLFFAGSSTSWGGGGIAYLDPVVDERHRTLGRLWLITTEQFEDVYRQENRRDEPIPIDHDALATEGHLDLLDTSYGRVLHLGPGPGGAPIATFTCSDPDRPQPQQPAAAAYRLVMMLGLVEAWGLDEAAAADYLTVRDRLGSKHGRA